MSQDVEPLKSLTFDMFERYDNYMNANNEAEDSPSNAKDIVCKFSN